jgi:hypothetical protein
VVAGGVWAAMRDGGAAKVGAEAKPVVGGCGGARGLMTIVRHNMHQYLRRRWQRQERPKERGADRRPPPWDIRRH